MTNDPKEPEPQPTQPAEVEHRSDVGQVDVVKRVCDCVHCRDEGYAVPPMPVVISCPICGLLHVDEGVWAKTPHRKHRCVDWEEVVEERDAEGTVISSTKRVHRGCGFVWKPSLIHTVGVRNI